MLNFPKWSLEDLKKSIMVYESVEKTHKGLGQLAVFDSLSDIANRCVMVVGCASTGKSKIAEGLIERVKRSHIVLDSITVQGLKKLAKILSYNEASVYVDDVSKGQTEYSQFATVSVFSSLCYTGRITKFTGALDLDIQGFKGSCIMNLQPLLLRKIIRLNEYETDIRDKVIRYYHFRFPIVENMDNPKFDGQLVWHYLDSFNLPYNDAKSSFLDRAFDNFRYEFTRARAREHLNAYLNASTRFNDRAKVSRADMWLIWQLSRNFRVEPTIMIKKSLEGSRELNENLLPLLTSLATWKKPPIQEMTYRFGVKRSQLYEIIGELKDYAYLVRGKGLVVPTQSTIELLKDIGEW